ncbi:MAG TPA: DNA gyrase subunit A [Candidatus Hypogeohydataceae bacterium YC41]
MIEPRENVRELFIEEEMKGSYLTFAMSVIVSRALPDVRDGLKPSQRRILVAMNDLGLSPRAKFRKCAKIAGDTTGNYHPHGEQVVYPTLVRMAQDFNIRYPLIKGQGNFGSIDGDPPAAMRYTEARLTEASMALLEDLDKDTADFVPNYDDTRLEPTVLPSKFPNLLCNGCTGIAVGMATSIPPHNINEICDGILKVIDNSAVPIEELLTIVKGPDFPTGGLICGTRGILEGYTAGRGTVVVRARAHVENIGADRKQIVFTEIPYQLNRDNIIARIAELVKEEQITGVSDVRNESDREGCRVVVELKKGEDENVVLNQLYKLTQLQDSFSVIMIALVDGRPQTLNLKELLLAYRDHRMEVIRRRTRHLLQKAEHRAHILEGLRVALKEIDEVVRLIRASQDIATARASLMARFQFTTVQADAILEMRLQRLTSLEHGKIEEEHQQLLKDIQRYRDILAKEELVLDIIRKEVREIKEKFGDERRTEVVGEAVEFEKEDLIAEEDMAIIMTHQGYLKRIPVSTYRRQERGGRGVSGGDLLEGDFVEHIFVASTHDYLLFFTDQGRVYWQKVYDIPQQSRQARGRAVVNLLEMKEGEVITSMIPVRKFDQRYLVMATEKGQIKKTPLEAFRHPKRGGIIALGLKEGDKLIGVSLTSGSQEILLGTEQGKAVRFHESRVRPMGRTAAGVRAIRLKVRDRVKGLVVVEEGETLLTVCETGLGKRTAFTEYTTHGRGGQGVINADTEKAGKVVALIPVRETDELMLLTAKGNVVRTAANTISVIGRNTRGVKLISLEEGDRLVSVARVAEEPDSAELTDKAAGGEKTSPEEVATPAEEGEGVMEPFENPSSPEEEE